MVTQIFSNKILNFFFNRNRNRNQRNLVTVTVTQTHGERVSHLHSSLVTWLRGYVVTQIFQTTFLSNFSTHVTVTSVTWLRLRLHRYMVRESHIYTAAWLRGYAVTWLRNLFSTFFQPFFQL